MRPKSRYETMEWYKSQWRYEVGRENSKSEHPRKHTLYYICRYKLNHLSYPAYLHWREVHRRQQLYWQKKIKERESNESMGKEC